MYINDKLVIGKNSEKDICLNLSKACMHGIITGASGSGKTTTLKVMAESFSDASVPVFLVDIKGDLSGLAFKGLEEGFVPKSVESLGIEDFEYKSFPVTFLDLYGKKGHSVRTTVAGVGADLLAKMLNLTDAQEGILSIVFKIAKDENLKLIDLKDLKEILTYCLENKNKYTGIYGNITSQSIGTIQRNILVLERDGGDFFFGKPDFDLKDLMHYDANTGKGYINVFNAEELFKTPSLYAVFLVWLLTSIYNNFEEVGSIKKPKLVLFFDEAHLIFSEMPANIIKQITGIVKLIRSKGVGVYFISQSPSDIPGEVLAQLGNKIQHVLRSYTPAEEKKVKAAASSFRSNPKFDMISEIKSLKTGEALISFLDENGEPSITEKAFVVPPQSRVGVITDTERMNLITSGHLYNKYKDLIDEESAFEILSSRKEKVEEKKETKKEEKKSTKKKKDSVAEKYAKKIANSTASTIGRKIGNSIFKSLFK